MSLFQFSLIFLYSFRRSWKTEPKAGSGNADYGNGNGKEVKEGNVGPEGDGNRKRKGINGNENSRAAELGTFYIFDL